MLLAGEPRPRVILLFLHWKPSHLVPGVPLLYSVVFLHLCTFPYLLALQEISGLLARFLGTPGSFHWKNRHGIQDLGTDVLAATGILLLLGPLMDRAKKYMIHACMYVY